MRYTTQVDLIAPISTPDGMGGFTSTIGVVDTLFAHMTPVKAELLLKAYGLTTSKGFRLVLKDAPTVAVSYYSIDGERYKLIEQLDYSRYSTLIVEQVK